MRLLARAWYVAHRGHQALPAGVVLAVLFAAFGSASISFWGTVRHIPLWAFVPGTLVMIAGTTLDGRLDHWPAHAEGPGRLARALWVGVIFLGASALAVPTAVTLERPVIVTTTTVLLVAAFAPAVIDVRSVILVGAAFDLSALVFATRVETDGAVARFLGEVPLWVCVTLVVAGLIGVADYVRSGARRLLV